MKPALAILIFATGCATREVVKIQKVPVIERQESIIVIPVPTPMKPPTMKRQPSEYWA